MVETQTLFIFAMLTFGVVLASAAYMSLTGNRALKRMAPEDWGRHKREFLHELYDAAKGSPACGVKETKFRKRLPWSWSVFNGVRDDLRGGGLIRVDEQETWFSEQGFTDKAATESEPRKPATKTMLYITTQGADFVRKDPDSPTAPKPTTSIVDSVVNHGDNNQIAHRATHVSQSRVSSDRHHYVLQEFTRAVEVDVALSPDDREQAKRLAAQADVELAKPDADMRFVDGLFGAMQSIAAKAGWMAVDHLLRSVIP